MSFMLSTGGQSLLASVYRVQDYLMVGKFFKGTFQKDMFLHDLHVYAMMSSFCLGYICDLPAQVLCSRLGPAICLRVQKHILVFAVPSLPPTTPTHSLASHAPARPCVFGRLVLLRRAALASLKRISSRFFFFCVCVCVFQERTTQYLCTGGQELMQSFSRQ